MMKMWLVTVRRSVVVLLLVGTVLLGLFTPSYGYPEELKLVDNGYEGLVVAISDSVPQEHCNHVIHGLKVR